MNQTLKKTPLYEEHLKLKAKIVPFAGYEMPVQYKGVMEEHRCVREKGGLFDISHMGEIFVFGPNARKFINLVTTNNIEKISNGRCQYSVMCNEEGGIVDDVVTYQFTPEKFMIVVNASNIEKDYNWLVKNKIEGVTIENKSDEYFQLALQGPMAINVLQPFVDFGIPWFSTFHFKEIIIDNTPLIISRTGYTGEDGFEIYGPAGKAVYFWDLFLKAGLEYGLQPIGLAARDTLRLEAAYSLYGQEIDDTISPLEARLNWVVRLDKEDFIGKKALIKLSESGIKRQLVGIEIVGHGVPRTGFEVFKGEQKIGCITSGTFSPLLGKSIGLALIQKDFSNIGSEVEILIRKNKVVAKIVPLPFYKKPLQ